MPQRTAGVLLWGSEHAAQQRDEGGADERHAASRDQLSHIQLNVKRAPKILILNCIGG